jgi:hypothetical protein
VAGDLDMWRKLLPEAIQSRIGEQDPEYGLKDDQHGNLVINEKA